MLDFRNNKYQFVFLQTNYYMEALVSDGFDFIQFKESKNKQTLTNTVPFRLRYPDDGYIIIEKENFELIPSSIVFAVKK